MITHISFADGDDLWQRLPMRARNDFVLHLRCNSEVVRIELMISGSAHLLQPKHISFEPLSLIAWLLTLGHRIKDAAKRDGFAVIGTLWQGAIRLGQPGTAVISGGSVATSGREKPYDAWIRLFDENPQRDLSRHHERLETLTRNSSFSILVTAESWDGAALDQLASSLANQIYRNWQLLVAVPPTGINAFEARLSKLLMREAFCVIAREVHISATRDLLLSQAFGDFLIFPPIDAILRPNALLELALTLNSHPDATLIYSDEDQIGTDGTRQTPLFKPAWSPDVFDVFDYFGNLVALRRSNVIAADGWRDGFGSALDHDLKLRIVKSVSTATIVHLAKILVHMTQPAPAHETREREPIERSIIEHCRRRHLNAGIIWPEDGALPRLKYRLSNPAPLVSLIIPTRDRVELLETCVRSILTLTDYSPYEILIVDNGSREERSHRYFAELRLNAAVRILDYPGPFNFSALNNHAARQAKGTILGLLNNDVEVRDADWLGEMAALAARPEIGCVGCKLLYPNGLVQHGGVFLGIGGLAGHGHRFAAGEAAGYMGRLSMLQNVSVVTAACLFVRKDTYEKVGGLDEQRLGVALNDVDFCLKVRAAGYLNLWTPFVALTHHESVSRGSDYATAKARRLWSEVAAFRRRWGPELFVDPYYSPNLTHDREDFSLRTR